MELPREKAPNTDIWEGPFSEKASSPASDAGISQESTYLLRADLPISSAFLPADKNRQPGHTRYFRETTNKDRTNTQHRGRGILF